MRARSPCIRPERPLWREGCHTAARCSPEAHPVACDAPLPSARQSSLLPGQTQHTSCLNWLRRLGFAFKGPKKRPTKANESKRDAFVAGYAALGEEAQLTGAKVFFVDEAHFRADAELRGKWVLRGEPALVDSTSPKYGGEGQLLLGGVPGTGEVEWMGASAGSAGGQQQQRNLGCLPGAVAGEAQRTAERDLG